MNNQLKEKTKKYLEKFIDQFTNYIPDDDRARGISQAVLALQALENIKTEEEKSEDHLTKMGIDK